MFGALKEVLGLGPKADFAALARDGALILDVRTPEEFRGGHIEGSLNISVQSLSTRLGELKKDRAVITCCASGARSAMAKGILKSEGFTEVHNGGGWRGLKTMLG